MDLWLQVADLAKEVVMLWKFFLIAKNLLFGLSSEHKMFQKIRNFKAVDFLKVVSLEKNLNTDIQIAKD